MGLHFHFGTAEHVPVIDKNGLVGALLLFHKQHLPIVRMACAYVHQPRHPKEGAMLHTLKSGRRQNFKDPALLIAKVA